MRSSRIARNTARILGAVAISAALMGAATAPAHAAHGVKGGYTLTGSSSVGTKAHGV